MSSIRMTGAIIAMAMALSSCATDTDTGNERIAADDGIKFNAADWSPFRITGDEVEGYQSLQEMASRADAVVVGKFTSGSSRQLLGDSKQDVVVYAQGTFEVSEVLFGNAPSTVTIEFLGQPDAEVPTGVQYVVFLRNKSGRGEEGLTRAVNSFGLWAESDGSLVTPLAESVDAGAKSYRDEVGDRETLAEFAFLLRQYSDAR